MAFPHSHKHVIVLDHSPALLRSCKETIEFDVIRQSRTPAFIPLAPITKSLWTCNVEAIVEYTRVVYDIFPTDKLITLVSSDTEGRVLNSWSAQEQNLPQMMMSLAHVGPPKKESKDSSIMHGLSQAIQVLCEPSENQHTIRTSLTDNAGHVQNRGRIICMTSMRGDIARQIDTIEQCVQDAILEHNKLTASTDNLMPITHCELCIVNVTPVGNESTISRRGRAEVSPLLSSELHISQSGHFIAAKMVELAMHHYGLASTTVTGIPMKEEQNASSSANYDVELLHSQHAHDELGSADGLVTQSKEGLYTTTVTLKWCTPKSSTVELQHCNGAYRISPVDVNSRPSSCLTNFLLSGRAVMLEQPKKTGTRVVSHMLASHGGEIYIHALATTRSMLEDPPSISEGCGGRVTDYRINDFGEVMKENRLAPSASVSAGGILPIERAKQSLERVTRCWPMVIGDTIIFNMLSHLDPLPSLIVKEHLTEDEVLECRKAIYHVVGMESRNESLPMPSTGTRGKGPKREEQYRQMWNELEKFLRAHSSNSPDHEKILDCLLDCKKPTESAAEKKKQAADKGPSKEEETEAAWKELDKFNKMTEREKTDLNKMDTKVTPDSPPIKRLKPSMDFGKSGTSLLSLWTTRLNTMHAERRAEFTGRLESTGPQAELYKHMNEDNGDLPEEPSSTSHSNKPGHGKKK